LGSGKSTVAEFLRGLGAEVIEADALGRDLMEPGHTVYAEIVRVFGPEVVGADGRLIRRRLNELNVIVHPAVIAAQQRWMQGVFERNPAAVAVIESALIFEVERDARARGEQESVLSDWRRRMDRVVVVTAADELKIARYVARLAPEGRARDAVEADARRRLAHQIPDAEKAARADYVIDNNSDIGALKAQVEALWERLKAESNKLLMNESLE
jgi:dephospho-CoA kinase